MTLETSCLDSGFLCNYKLVYSSDFIKFLKKFDENYKKYYTTRNWQCLKRYVTYSINVLDYSPGCGYSERVKELLFENSNSLSSFGAIQADSEVCSTHFERNDNSFEYYGLLSTIISTSNPKFYDNPDLGIPELDAIVSKYVTYTNLYTSLADVYVRLCEFNLAFKSLIELSVILYLIRCDVKDLIKALGRKNVVADLPAICRMLNENRIYIDESYNIENPKIILKSSVRYWIQEIQFEIWSVLVKIWLRTPCIYSVTKKIESLELSSKVELLLNFDIFWSNNRYSLNREVNCINDQHESIDFCENLLSYSKLELGNLKINLTQEFIISYLFALPFNYQGLVIEGLLFISHVCRDLSHSTFCYIYSILNDALSIYTCMLANILNIKGWCKDVQVSMHSKDLLKTEYKGFVIPHTIFITHDQHIFNEKVFCIPSYSNQLNLWTEKGETSKTDTIFYELCKSCFLLKDDLEFQILFNIYTIESPGIIFSETITLPYKYFNVAIDRHFVGGKSRTYTCSNYSCKISSTKIYANISNEQQYATISKSISLCSFIRVSKLPRPYTKERKLKFSTGEYPRLKYLKAIKYSRCDISSVLIYGVPDVIAFSILSLLFSFGDIYSYIHYSQSIELLHYKDLLKKKQRTFIRYFLPLIPSRSTKQTKKILSFQKHIKKEFKENLIFSHCSVSKVLKKTISIANDKHIPLLLHQCFPLYSNYIEKHKEKETLLARKFILKIWDSTGIRKVKGYIRSLLNISRSNILTYKFKHFHKLKRILSPNISRAPITLGLGVLETEPYRIDSLSSRLNCVHISMTQDHRFCEFCHKFKMFEHMDHMLFTLDLLAHFLFTYGIGKKCYTTPYLIKSVTSDRINHFGKRTDLFVKDNTKISGINKVIYSILVKEKKFHYLPKVNTLKILEEFIENIILLSFATFFSENYHNKLISRLSMVKLMLGRCNLFLKLILQTLSHGSYKTSISYNGKHYGLSEFEPSFKAILTWKAFIELFNKPFTFQDFCSIINDIGLLPCTDILNSHRISNMDEEYMVNIGKLKYPPSKLLLMDGVSHLKLSNNANTLCSIPITEIQSDMIYVRTGSKLTYFVIKSDRNTRKKLYSECSMHDNSIDGISLLMSSAKLIFEAISLDPLDYKAWLYLSHCGLFLNDYYFAYKCSKRSIECFDSCIASWLVFIISISSRVKTFAPSKMGLSPCNENVTVYNTNIQTECVTELVPSPFYPILYGKNDAHYVMMNYVGGDLDKCLSIIYSLDHFNDIYLNSALLQLLSRTSKYYNPIFPWEYDHFSVHIIEHNNLGFLPEPNIANSTTEDSYLDEEYSNCLKQLIKNATDNKLMLCSQVFMGSIAQMFSKREFNFQCGCHADSISFSGLKDIGLNSLEEEIYGWITCIEVLAQTGQHETSQLLLPLLKNYVDVYEVVRCNKDQAFVKAPVEKAEDTYKNVVEQSLGYESIIGTNLGLEFKFLEMYTRCFNTKNSRHDLTNLLSHIREESLKQYYRKLSLLENRILVALNLYNESVELCGQIHRINFRSSQQTDFELESISLKAYSYALSRVQEYYKASIVDMFANQCRLTTPIIKLDLCLNVPL
ncbi:hypothetical protein BEWA_010450 [Theileria equi strain WA]|uniref:Uncharacterized protein n=1 Tax=Theileria equi strain WA TaxID=1537102 RepID=L0B2A8_THEEQ|nr:hypothetical protein BEWA_010450 [Theileria equi strain WA]AFZ81628.1 hypothetical protein BEWA_010450 [Theileria equi strain WA]|eukprot:XP_004831294.1 hypothetical protein BEWA_010450 [Theileria equi strain WA]